MRATRLVLPWSAVVLFSGAIAGCAATASSRSGWAALADASLTQTTPDEWRQLRDSAKAQEVADEVGPRVSVTADFDYSESRRVDVTFHMYDDAYVIVGHLDAERPTQDRVPIVARRRWFRARRQDLSYPVVLRRLRGRV